MENSSDEQEDPVKQVYQFASNLMINEKKKPDEIKSVLIDEGLDEETATFVVTDLEQHINDLKQASANKDMLFGALWGVGGIIVTAATYLSASGGGTYFVAWGAIIFGAIQFLKGLVKSLS